MWPYNLSYIMHYILSTYKNVCLYVALLKKTFSEATRFSLTDFVGNVVSYFYI